MQKVMIYPAGYDSVRRAIERAFSLFPMDIGGKKVLIKPNVLRSAKPDEGITTHPSILRAVVEKVEDGRPDSIVVGDNPGIRGYGANEQAFAQSGLLDAAKGYYQNIGSEMVSLPFNQDFIDAVSVSKIVLEADLVISLPKFKTHGLTVLTGGIKNSYGFLPGAQKARLHKRAGTPERFHDLVVDIFRLRIPDLFIMDGILGMEGNGPASLELREIGVVLASDNAVALDAVMARMMGLDPFRLRFLQQAQAQGLGSFDHNAISLDGELKVIPDFKLPPLGGEAIHNSQESQELLQSRIELLPRVDPESCTACGACVEHCPVQALSMIDGLPLAREGLCITCFCCQEICPEKALSLQ